jgi:hypothetical protein
MDNCQQIVAELLRITPNKLRYYQRGQRAMKLIMSTF